MPRPEPDITLCLCLCKWHATLVLDNLLLQAFELLELIGAEACALLLFLLLLVVLAGLLLGGLLHGLRLLDLRKHRRLRDEVAEPLLYSSTADYRSRSLEVSDRLRVSEAKNIHNGISEKGLFLNSHGTLARAP